MGRKRRQKRGKIEAERERERGEVASDIVTKIDRHCKYSQSVT